jgi:hypothetical protein
VDAGFLGVFFFFLCALFFRSDTSVAVGIRWHFGYGHLVVAGYQACFRVFLHCLIAELSCLFCLFVNVLKTLNWNCSGTLNCSYTKLWRVKVVIGLFRSAVVSTSTESQILQNVTFKPLSQFSHSRSKWKITLCLQLICVLVFAANLLNLF